VREKVREGEARLFQLFPSKGKGRKGVPQATYWRGKGEGISHGPGEPFIFSSTTERRKKKEGGKRGGISLRKEIIFNQREGEKEGRGSSNRPFCERRGERGKKVKKKGGREAFASEEKEGVHKQIEDLKGKKKSMPW